MSKLLNAIRSKDDSDPHLPDDPIANNIVQALKKTDWRLSRIERISGGNANFTYRGWLKKPAGYKESYDTIIIKHAEPYVALNREWAIDVERANYEQLMIETLSSRDPTKHNRFIVRTPKFLSAQELPYTMLMEDLPTSLTVKEYLFRYGENMLPGVAREMGISIGKWLRDYHTWVNSNDEKAMMVKQRMSGNKSMVDAREQLYIGSYRDAMKNFPSIAWPRNGQLDIIEKDIKRTSREGGSAIHGDFWTGNMILKDKPLASEDGTTYPTKILILDFEVSQLGSRPQDMAQCLAELYMVHHFYGSQAPLHVMNGLIEGYFAPTFVADKYDRNELHEDPKSKWSEKDRLNFALNTSMHFGIHLVTIPHKFGWPKGDKMMTCARLGNDYLIDGHDANCPKFRNGPLHDLFPSFPPPPKTNRTEVVKKQKKSKWKALFCGCFGGQD